MSHALDDAAQRELHRDLGVNVAVDCAGHNYNANHASMTLTSLYVLRSLVPADANEQRAAASDAIAQYRSVTLDEVRSADTPSFGADVDGTLAVTSEEQVWGLVGRRAAISGVGKFLIEHLTATLRRAEESDAFDRQATIGRWLAKWLGHALVRGSVGCAAVHGILRIAFGLGVDFVPDIAFGVATVITNHFRTPMPAKGDDAELAVAAQDAGDLMAKSVAAVLASEALRNFDFLSAVATAPVGGIDGRCYVLFQLPEFAAAVPRLDGVNPLVTVSKMLDLAVGQFQQYHDFSALHIFTGAAGMLQLMTALEGHLSTEVASDLLTGFWAEALAIVAMLPRLEAVRKANGTMSPLAQQAPNGPAISDVDAAALLALETASRKQRTLTPSEFEHQVKLAYAARVAVQGRTEPDFVAACIAIVVREANAPAPF